MAELMRKFFEMNDMDVLIIGVLYFGSVLIGGIYCIKKWKEEENDKKRQGSKIDRVGRTAARQNYNKKGEKR